MSKYTATPEQQQLQETITECCKNIAQFNDSEETLYYQYLQIIDGMFETLARIQHGNPARYMQAIVGGNLRRKSDQYEDRKNNIYSRLGKYLTTRIKEIEE